jgi:flagellar biosynthesis chaperone FliJ
MISELKQLLKQAKKEKEEAVKPYNKRIRNLSKAIRNLEEFDGTSLEINSNPHAQVIEVPKPEEGANYAN